MKSGTKPGLNKIRKDTTVTKTRVDTGEVVDKYNQTSYFPARFDEEKGYLWKAKSNGARMFAEVPFPKEMSMVDRGRMSTLAKYIWNKTNLLAYRGHGGIRPYSVKQIGKLVELDDVKADWFLKRMIGYKMIKPVSVPFGERIEIQYYVNPLYFCSDKRLSLNLYVLFHEELDEHLPDWVKEEFAKAGSGDKVKQVN